MNKAIAFDKATVLSYADAGEYWQQRISRLGLSSPESTSLVMPNDISALAEVVCQAAEQKWQLIPSGKGSKLDWGGLTDIDLILSTQKCDRIIHHAVDDLTVTVEAGITLDKLQETLSAAKQFLPIDPAFPHSATIGGILATADTGSLRHRYGGIRDLVLGVSFVRGDGKIAKAGGKVVKNVAGYDLMKLLIGSYGTLGIITEVTFRTYPLPTDSQTLILTGKPQAIAEAIARLRNSGLTPTAADLVSPGVSNKLGIADGYAFIVRFQTIPESITAQTQQLKDMVAELDIAIATNQEADLWQQLQISTTPDSETTICKVGILPQKAMTLLQQITAKDPSYRGIIHIGSGIGRIELHQASPQTLQEIRNTCNANQGFLTVLSAPLELKQQVDIWGCSGNALNMMRTIKNKFDPQGIFSSDRFIV